MKEETDKMKGCAKTKVAPDKSTCSKTKEEPDKMSCTKTKEEPDKTKDCGKTTFDPDKTRGGKMTFDPEQVGPGDMIVLKGIYPDEPKEEYEWAKYIVLQKVVTTSRLRDEPRTAFKALLSSCHVNNMAMRDMVGYICYITKSQFDIRDGEKWWETVVESGLSWEEGKDRCNVLNAEVL